MSRQFGGGFATDPQIIRDLLDRIDALLIGHRSYHAATPAKVPRRPKVQPMAGPGTDHRD